ncbi:HNH endonuclease [Mycolicibacterium sp. XJ2546]
MRQCRGCGSPFSKRSQKVYCSNACQPSFRRHASTKHWIRQPPNLSHPSVNAQGCCATCGGAGTWLGMPLALVLAHVDGSPTNNRRENLPLGCPNCDTQLPTYKSRNRGKGRHFRRQRYANWQSY